MRTIIAISVLMFLTVSCTRRTEPFDADIDTPTTGPEGTRPPYEIPVNDTLRTLTLTTRISYHYEDFHHTFILRSTSASAMPGCNIVYGLGHDKSSFPYNHFSFGASQLGEYYDEIMVADTLVITLRAPFWFLYSRVAGHVDYAKKVSCDDAYETGNIRTLMMYEEEGNMFYHPFPAALVNGGLLFDLSPATI